nr:hypothetical protein [Allosalinactinospora lopnorensis]
MHRRGIVPEDVPHHVELLRGADDDHGIIGPQPFAQERKGRGEEVRFTVEEERAVYQ